MPEGGLQRAAAVAPRGRPAERKARLPLTAALARPLQGSRAASRLRPLLLPPMAVQVRRPRQAAAEPRPLLLVAAVQAE